MTSINDILSYFLTYFRQNSGCSATLPIPPPLPLVFTAITDHPRAGKVPPGCGPQSIVEPVNIPVSFRSRAEQSEGGCVFSVRRALSLCLSALMLPHCSGQISKAAVLYYTWWKRGQKWTDPCTWQTSRTPFQLGLMEAFSCYSYCTPLSRSVRHTQKPAKIGTVSKIA
jgi:hypothetical protein